MRPFFLLIIGFLLFAVVFSVVIFLPHSDKTNVIVNRIDFNRQPQPVVQSDPGGDYILEFFPEPTPEQNDPSLTEALQDAEPSPKNSQSGTVAETALDSAQVQKELDKNRIISLIHDWVYTDFMEVGRVKQGTIKKTRENLSFTVYEGEQLDNGIEIESLTNDAVLLALGEAKFPLRRAKQPKFYEEVKRTMRPLTPEEQEQAYDYYMRVYGDKFKEMSKNYKPPHGMPTPGRVSKEQQVKALEEYWSRYGKQFSKESANYKPEFHYPKNMRDAYEKYWNQFGNGQEKPQFEDIFEKPGNTGPDARLVPAEQLQQQQ